MVLGVLRMIVFLVDTALWIPVVIVASLADPQARFDRMRGGVMSETTDGHSYSLGGLSATGGPTGVPDIDDVLFRYRQVGGGSTRGNP